MNDGTEYAAGEGHGSVTSEMLSQAVDWLVFAAFAVCVWWVTGTAMAAVGMAPIGW